MLQTRNAKRPAQAAVRFAVDAVGGGPARPRGGDLRRSTPPALDALLHPTFDPARRLRGRRERRRRLARRGQGRDRAERAPTPSAAAEEGREVILVRSFTEADDVAGFHAAQRDPHERGRQGEPRRARRARHGPPGGHRRERRRGRRGRGRGAHRRARAARGRSDRDRRQPRADHARGRAAGRAAGLRAVPDGARVVRRAAHARRARQRRHARRRREGDRARRRRRRPVPHRAHVPGRAPAADGGRDHGRGRGGARRGDRAAAARCRSPTSSRSCARSTGGR